LPSKKEVRRIDVPEEVTAAAFSPDGTLMAIGTQKGGYHVWDVRSGKVVREAQGDGNVVAHLSISRDNKSLATVAHPEAIRIVELESGKVTGPFAPAIGDAWDVTFSPDGSIVATADDDTAVHLWSAESGKLIRQFDDSLLAPFAVRFSRDGRFLLKGGADRKVHLVDLSSGKLIKEMVTGKYVAMSVELSPDARYAAVQTRDPGSFDYPAPLQVWDVKGGNKVQEIANSGWTSVAFTDTGTLLVADSKDKTATVVSLVLPK
jgi:dipeptidyl aminopeptidase/acylaminoacyl peptidase